MDSSIPLRSITLLLGWPSKRLLPTNSLSIASAETLSDPTTFFEALSYGANQGNPAFRDAIAEWLSSFYTLAVGPTTPQRICITGGASQSLACILQVFTDARYTKLIWMVAPTYFLACKAFEDNGFAGRVRSVPDNEGGVDIEVFRRLLDEVDPEQRTSQDGIAVCFHFSA